MSLAPSRAGRAQGLVAFVRSLGYAGSGGRDPRLDWLRGYALFAMTVDHVGTVNGVVGTNSWLYAITGGTRYYTTAAEAFYLVSGVTLGLIASREPLGVATARIFRRALVLYRTAVAITLGFGAVGLWTALAFWGRWSFRETDPARFLARSLALLESAGGAGILVLYVLFMAVTPVALALMRRRLTWLVALASGIVYLASQAVPERVHLPFSVLFEPAAWQVFFFGGLVLGFHRARLTRALARVPRVRDALEGGIALFGVALLALHLSGSRAWPNLPRLLEPMEAMPPARLTLAAVSLAFIYLAVSWLWRPLRAALGWLLETLGRSSLWAFTAHLVVIFVLWNLPAFRADGDELWLWQLGAVALVWASIRLRAKIGEQPAREAR